ncbi:element excision factor XisH family protein [Brasilonema sp. UFV-L1]|uniref:element excision factor XisH family protein n=1 Tax=Brasilonema sp. UFV-L1 TaxID=2234130 RepID=UPI00145F530F|nr:element excision factor XisH family protein [Brasilonema sp. UFV-L1]NMG07168.1 fatty-acid synthase [Brasilonema sp. UFV-L1]
MPAKDVYHNVVITALEKDDWLITDDPLKLKCGTKDLYIDLGAEKLIAAEKGQQKIAVEIKSFLSQSPVTDLENALGQFILYYDILEEQGSDRILYLAIPRRTYTEIFTETIGKILLKKNRLRLLVFDPKEEVIVQWIP